MADLATEVRNAIIMLSNYARHDEKTGQIEDAEFTRAAVNRLLDAMAADTRMKRTENR
jgi:hypothetical protein